MNSDSENDEISTSPHILFDASNKNLLPEKSRKKYEKMYQIFLDWQKLKNVNSFDETVLLEYFEEVSQKYKSSSLWVQYSMLRGTINLNNNVDIENYSKLRAFLKSKAEGFRPKKVKTFTPDEINKFITEAPDSLYLITKVALILGISGACRLKELNMMNIKNFQDLGSAILVTVPNSKTKTVRKFTITENFYHICKKYIHLRPEKGASNALFLNYINGKCTKQKIGVNKFGLMGKQIAKFLNIPNPEIYTGHCFRRSSKALRKDADEEICSSTTLDSLDSSKLTQNLLAEQSKRKYKRVYHAFMDWRRLKNIDSFCESVFLDYFEELSEKYKSSSLWARYSMLRSTLNVNDNIDIGSYLKLRGFLKGKSKGYQAKKGKTFTPDEINKFIKEAPDSAYLSIKVALILGIMGGCRAKELHLMTIDDIQDLGSAMLVTVLDFRTKRTRKFTVTDHFYEICKNFLDLRPINAQSKAVFLNYQNGKCTSQKIGINKFGVMGKKIATFLELPDPEIYTGQCFRRSYDTLIVDAGGDVTMLKKYGRSRGIPMAEGYIDNCVKHLDVENTILPSSAESTSTEDNDNVELGNNIKTEPIDVDSVETQEINNSLLNTYIKIEPETGEIFEGTAVFNSENVKIEPNGSYNFDNFKNGSNSAQAIKEEYDEDENCSNTDEDIKNFLSNEEIVIKDDQTESNKKLENCRLCLIVIKDEPSLIQHFKSLHGPDLTTKKFHCAHCSYAGKTQAALDRHIKRLVHRTFKCAHCDYTTKKNYKLNSHMIIHTPDFPTIQCAFCESKYKRNSDLRKHVRLRHQNNCTTHKCTLCDYVSKRKGDIRTHMIVHQENPRTYACPQCDFKIKRKNDLRRHMQLHQSDCPTFDCPECFYKSKRKSDLRNHMKQHIKNTS